VGEFVVERRELAMGERWFMAGEEAIGINLNTTVCCAGPGSVEEEPTVPIVTPKNQALHLLHSADRRVWLGNLGGML
jgi:hypothetical protein